MLDRRFRPACKEKIEKFIETELAKQMRRLASVHKYLRICELCKELGIVVRARIFQRSGSGTRKRGRANAEITLLVSI